MHRAKPRALAFVLLLLSCAAFSQAPSAVMVNGTVVCFADERIAGYACALVEVEKGGYLAIWLPASWTDVVLKCPFSYYCQSAPDQLRKIVEFQADQYRTPLGHETLNPGRDDRAKRSGKQSTPIGETGSTYKKHVFTAIVSAIGKELPRPRVTPVAAAPAAVPPAARKLVGAWVKEGTETGFMIMQDGTVVSPNARYKKYEAGRWTAGDDVIVFTYGQERIPFKLEADKLVQLGGGWVLRRK